MDFGDGSIGDIPTRPMRVKILYTFDQDSKTNCLARFHDIVNIPAVIIEDDNQVGVIELGQCLQAIVSASPEIVSSLSEGDFTIYAHDYSELDTPLVGQGRLSSALAPGSPKLQEQTMITGRVCQNKLAIFSNGVKETLEVKLRLVPVPKPARQDGAKGPGELRRVGSAMSSGFDPNMWSGNGQQSHTPQVDDYFNFDALSTTNEQGMTSVEEFFGLESTSSGSGSGQQILGGMGIAGTPTDPPAGFNPAFSHSAPGSRAASPIISSDSNTRNDLLRHQSFSGNTSRFTTDQSRPASRASVRSEVQTPTHQRQASATSIPQQTAQLETEVYFNEDGQPRKRAKVMQTDWRGRSSFGSKSSDLRVTAATAASMHMHRPIPNRPNAPGSNLEPPPRVPTPVPQRTVMLPHQQVQLGARRSLLRQASTAGSDFMSDIDNVSDAVVSSPEEESPGNSITADGTPQDIPSSPPVFQGGDLPQPSSPGLPTLPASHFADSGYMSERGLYSGNAYNSVEHDEDRSPVAEDYQMAAQYKARRQRSQPYIKTEGSEMTPASPMYTDDALNSGMNVNLERPGDMNQLPHKMLLDIPPPRRAGSQGPTRAPKPTETKKPAASPVDDVAAATPAPAQTPGEQPQSRRGSLALPPNPPAPSSDQPDASQKPAPKKRKSVQRTRTSSNDSEAGSPAPSDNEGRSRGPQRSGSGAQRRKLIEQRLETSLSKGEMPQFCSHCGAIETPTWRKIYVKECTGKPTLLDKAEGEGETIGVQVTEKDEVTGVATKFLIRKTMKKTKDNVPGPGFEDAVLCNPCGLWFNKFKQMRPPSKWHRKAGTRKSKKQKDGDEEPGLSTDGFEPPSDMFFTDQNAPDDDFDSGEGSGDGQLEGQDVDDVMPPPNGRPRSNSMQVQQQRRGSGEGGWKASQLDAALVRAVQSSPVRWHGSQASPIEIEDLTPKPTRRLLFPSPKRDGEVNSLDDNGQVSLKSMPPTDIGASFPIKPGMELDFDQTNPNVFETFTLDKENLAPPADGAEDDLSYLFDGSPSALFRSPFKTPRKTPQKRTPHSNGLLPTTPTPSSRKRKPMTPNANAANNANMNVVNDFMTSPASARYWLRSTPSRLERTPGRQSEAGQEVSPWSHHLAQMLSDANDTTFTSPSRNLPFSDIPTFTTPGRMLDQCDWDGLEGILSSEFASYEDADNGEDGTAEDL